MKLWNWIDSFLKTEEERKQILQICSLTGWLWQGIWLLLFMASLLQVSNADALLDFAGTMKNYAASFLIRMVLSLLSAGAFSFESLLHSLFTLHLADLFLFFLTAVSASAPGRKTGWKLLIVVSVLQLGILAGTMMAGFQAGSMLQVLLCLKAGALLSCGCSMLFCICAVSLLFFCIWALLRERTAGIN